MDNSISSYKLEITEALTMKDSNTIESEFRIYEDEEKSVSDLANFADRISFIVVASGYQLEVYDETDYGGNKVTFTGPKTVRLTTLIENDMDNAIKSYKLTRPNDEESDAILKLYEHDDENSDFGAGWMISENALINVSAITAAHDDKISKIEIADGYLVAVYEDTNYGGEHRTYHGPQTVYKA